MPLTQHIPRVLYMSTSKEDGTHVSWDRIANVTMAALLAALGLMWNGQRETISDLNNKVAALEGWKEGVGSRVSVVETKNMALDSVVADMRIDVRDMKKDITELLRRVK